MKNLTRCGVLATVLCLNSAFAEVTDVSEAGFTTVHDMIVEAPRVEVWRAAISEVGQWWSADHTVSGDATRLTITATTQGCFCEKLGEDAGVVHQTVTMVNPNVLLRLSGGLGPLGLMGVAGNMTWEFEDDGENTRVRFTYAVGGYLAGGLDAVAAPVDGVIGEALRRLKAHVETGAAETANIE